MSFAQRSVSLVRPARSAAAAASFASSARRPAPTASPAPGSDLSWPEYLTLRRSQRRVGLLTSIPTTVLGLSAGIQYFANIEAEPTALILGLEPVYAYGIATMSCMGLGWLAGPIVGNQIWKLFNRRALSSMEIKDKDFYEHIKRNRVDPSRQSVSNPVPDYYCEKVGTLKQYRQWLRDQSAYRRKSKFGGGEDELL